MYANRKFIMAIVADITEQKQIEKELNENTDMLNVTLENISDIVVLADTEGNITFHSNLYDTLGYEPDSIVGRNVLEFVHPEDLPEIERSLREFITYKEDKRRVEYRFRRGDGSYLWLETDGKTIKDEHGDIQKVLFSARDVTERRAAQDALAKSEEKYRLLFDYSNDAIFVHEMGENNLPSNNIAVNERAVRLLGYSREELLHMSAKDVVPEKLASTMYQHAQELKEKKHSIFETANIRSDGVVIPVEVSAYLYTEGNKDYVAASVRDITERKRLETEIRSKTEFLETVLDNMADMVALTDLAGNFTFIGKSHEVLGYNLTDLIDKNVMDFVHPDDYSNVEKEFSSFLQAKDKRKVEYRYRRADGRYLWFETHGEILTDADKNPEKIIFSTRDITERKELEEQLKKNKERYETIFHNSDVSLWEEDYSEVRIAIDKLKQEGVTDFHQFFEQNPAMAWELGAKIKVLDINEATLRLHGVESKEELLGSLGRTLYITEDTFNFLIDELTAIAEKRTSVKREMKTKTLHGEVLDISIGVYISREKDIMIAAATDITPYKNALKEKNFLMHELNHRVKNNLHLVASLISLKAGSLPEEVDLSDLKHQVDAIQTVHGYLSGTDGYTHISIKEYIQDILSSMFSTYAALRVETESRIEDIELATKDALSLGLITNEIATNAIKHGFLRDGKNTFSISLTGDTQADEYVFILSNSGKPFPEDIDIDNSNTMGMGLISGLVSQLGGTIELQKRPNPVFTIRFPRK